MRLGAANGRHHGDVYALCRGRSRNGDRSRIGSGSQASGVHDRHHGTAAERADGPAGGRYGQPIPAGLSGCRCRKGLGHTAMICDRDRLWRCRGALQQREIEIAEIERDRRTVVARDPYPEREWNAKRESLTPATDLIFKTYREAIIPGSSRNPTDRRIRRDSQARRQGAARKLEIVGERNAFRRHGPYLTEDVVQTKIASAKIWNTDCGVWTRLCIQPGGAGT